jgi:hypothetical protein
MDHEQTVTRLTFADGELRRSLTESLQCGSARSVRRTVRFSQQSLS